MRDFQIALATACLLSLSPVAAQDVDATFSIRPSDGGRRCELSSKTVEAISGALTPARIASLNGCPGRKISSFEILGSTTETYEFLDGKSRLQVTVQNNKILSRSLRRI